MKLLDFFYIRLKLIGEFLVSKLEALPDCTPNEFDYFEDVLKVGPDLVSICMLKVNIFGLEYVDIVCFAFVQI